MSAAQSLSSGVWSQLHQQQAQRIADRAEQNARALKTKAQEAEVQAIQAQENARSLSVEHDKAEGQAGSARQQLASLKSVSQLQQGMQNLREQISSSTIDAVKLDTDTQSAAATGGVVNALGQKTGVLVDVTA